MSDKDLNKKYNELADKYIVLSNKYDDTVTELVHTREILQKVREADKAEQTIRYVKGLTKTGDHQLLQITEVVRTVEGIIIEVLL